jgi:hypothetical protein
MGDSSSSNNPNTIEKPAEKIIPGFGTTFGLIMLSLAFTVRRYK